MAGQANAAPVIIKRKKNVVGGGHHGGAWKVAYADFVTAMMAFFMLMWLLNATTEKQRKGIADYFSPTIPINRVSGGGDGAFGGNSVLAENTLSQNGTGAAASKPTADRQASGTAEDDAAKAAEEERLAEVEKSLLAKSGESMTMERLLRHIVTRVTDEGLVIELFDLPEAALFAEDTAQPSPVLQDLSDVLADVLAATQNDLAIAGFVRSYPLMMKNNPVWPLSADRAQAMRNLLRTDGLTEDRFARVSGFADKKPLTPDPSVLRNNRLEVILLRSDR